MKSDNDPTKATYSTLQAAWSHFNKALFGNQLPHCLVTFQRQRGAFGYFSAQRFENRVDQSVTDEIALHPKHIRERSPEDTLSTLVHEMTHLWQQHFGKPGRGRYHNKQWADRMSELGLEPSDTGEPGGKRVGDRVSHCIVDDGPFDRACRSFLAKNLGLLWGDRPVEHKTGGTRAKYVCQDEDCRLAMWGRSGVQILCAEHDRPIPMAEQQSSAV